jgi:hypothetical protein
VAVAGNLVMFVTVVVIAVAVAVTVSVTVIVVMFVIRRVGDAPPSSLTRTSIPGLRDDHTFSG